jgi:transposase
MTRLYGWAPRGERLVDKVPQGKWNVRKAVKAAGARLLFLPKCSPDLNPIEQVFAKIKDFVRKAAPRTLDGVSHAIAQALATIPPAECQNYLAGAGCASA